MLELTFGGVQRKTPSTWTGNVILKIDWALVALKSRRQFSGKCDAGLGCGPASPTLKRGLFV